MKLLIAPDAKSVLNEAIQIGNLIANSWPSDHWYIYIFVRWYVHLLPLHTVNV